MSRIINPYVEWLKLPESNTRPSYYALLGIDESEDDERRIRGAYYKRVAVISVHQNGNTAEVCQNLLVELAEARDCLVDPDARERYNETLHRGASVFQSAPTVSMKAEAARSAARKQRHIRKAAAVKTPASIGFEPNDPTSLDASEPQSPALSSGSQKRVERDPDHHRGRRFVSPGQLMAGSSTGWARKTVTQRRGVR